MSNIEIIKYALEVNIKSLEISEKADTGASEKPAQRVSTGTQKIKTSTKNSTQNRWYRYQRSLDHQINNHTKSHTGMRYSAIFLAYACYLI